MSSQIYQPNSVHLVGSVGLRSGEEVFATAGRLLGRRLKRIPDGEPGGRRMWISWQIPVLRANPFFELVDKTRGLFGQMKLIDGVDPDAVVFDELGYALEARASYQDFLAARARGDIAAGVRFQVSLPTPYAVVRSHFTPDALPVAWRAYRAAMVREVERICARIPHEDLCVQWDVCHEMCIWDGGGEIRWNLPGDARTEIIDQLTELSSAVPDDVELGFHLCYGDLDAKHFFNPKDSGAMVEISNAITASVQRPISYIHMPVPIDRDDDAYFAPLSGLKLDKGTEIYLGVVHAPDGVEGLERRVAAAGRYLPAFGIATECGMARSRTIDLVKRLLELHVQGAREPSAT